MSLSHLHTSCIWLMILAFMAQGVGLPAPARAENGPAELPPLPAATGEVRTTFIARPLDKQTFASVPGFLLQRGESRSNGYSLLAEMGDLELNGIAPGAPPRRGARLGLATGNAANSASIGTFAVTGNGAGAGESLLAGLNGDLSLGERARFKSVFMHNRELASGRESSSSLMGLSTVLTPAGEKLALEGGSSLSLSDAGGDTRDAVLHNGSYHIKAGGKYDRYRYGACFERIGPGYRVPYGAAPATDRKGVTLNLGSSLGDHSLDMRVARHHDNLARNPYLPRLYRQEGTIDYSYKGMKSLPLGVSYTKATSDSTREPAGTTPQRTMEDAVTGRVNYLPGTWDLGLRAGYSNNRDRQTPDGGQAAQSVGFTPKFKSDNLTVTPDLSIKHSSWIREQQQSMEYALMLAINSKDSLDCRVGGGYGRERSAASPTGKETVGASVKVGYPLARYLKAIRQPSVAIQGDYTGSATGGRVDNNFSLLLMFDGKSFL